MLLCMRTTLSLDPDVAALLRRTHGSRGGSFKALVNEALRQGLRRMSTPPPDRSTYYRTPTADLGRCLHAGLDDVAEVLAVAEGERFR